MEDFTKITEADPAKVVSLFCLFLSTQQRQNDGFSSYSKIALYPKDNQIFSLFEIV